MVRVEKDGVIYRLNDGNQLSAFLSNGWQIYKPKKKVVVAPKPVVEEVKEEKPKPKRRRKKASK